MIRAHAKLGSRRDGRDLVWGLAALAFACALLGRPHPAEAGDCSAKTDCRYVPDNGNAALPVAAGATGVAVGTGLRRRRRRGPTAPVFKPPKEYTDPGTGAARDNPFDPPVDEQRDRWTKDHLIWDPQTLSWRPPKPGEVPPPPDAPESTPYQRTNPRDGTPPECLDLYDNYVQAQADVLQLEQDVQDAANRLQNAQLYLNQNLVKLTLQLQMDTADIFMAGASGVKSGMAIATAAASAGAAIGELLRAARTKLKYLEEVVARLIESVGQFSARMARIESSVSTLSASGETLAADAGEAETAVEAAQERVSVAQRRANLSSQVDELVAQRDAVVQEATDAESKLGVGENYWQRKQGLQEWANSEKAAAAEQNNRAFARVHGDLSDAEAQLDNLRVKDPQAAQAADQAVQAKLDEVRQAKANLEGARQPKYRLDSAQQVRDDAASVLESVTDEVTADQATADQTTESARQEWQGKSDAAEAADKEAENLRQIKAAQQNAAEIRDEAQTRLDHANEELGAIDDYQNKRAQISATLEGQLDEAKGRLQEAQQRLKAARDAEAQLNAQLEAQPADPASMTPQQQAQRQALVDQQAAADAEFNAADAEWEKYPAGSRPDEVSERYYKASNQKRELKFEIDEFDAEFSGRKVPMSPEQAAENARLQAEISSASKAVDEAQGPALDLQHQVDEAHSYRDQQLPDIENRRAEAQSKKSAAERDLAQADAKLADANQAVEQAQPDTRLAQLEADSQRLRGEADASRAKYDEAKTRSDDVANRGRTKKASAERDLKIAEDRLAEVQQQAQDVPIDQIHNLQDEYARLSREYDELRAQAEKLKSGTYRDDAKAAELQQRIGQLQRQLRDWKDPDWEDYAAQHDPAKYQQWKLEVEGTDPGADKTSDLGDLRQKVADLKQREDQLEKQIADLRDQMQPDTTIDSPQTALANAQNDLAAKQQAAAIKKQALDQAKDQLASAQADLTAAQAERDAKQQELQQAETDRDATQQEVDRLQSQQDAGGDMMQAPQGAVDTAQQVVQATADAAAAAKQYIVDKLKAGVSKVGKAWEWAFNGQSPDEIAQILKSQHDAVQQWVDELTQRQQALDQSRGALRDLKPQLDACVAAHVDTA